MIILVTGLPGTGKTTWVKGHMNPGDIVYDLDRIAGALTYSEEERENSVARYLANEMYDTFLSDVEWEDLPLTGDVYIIRTKLGMRELELLAGANAARYGSKVLAFTKECTDRGFSPMFRAALATELEDFLESCRKNGIEVKYIE